VVVRFDYGEVLATRLKPIGIVRTVVVLLVAT